MTKMTGSHRKTSSSSSSEPEPGCHGDSVVVVTLWNGGLDVNSSSSSVTLSSNDVVDSINNENCQQRDMPLKLLANATRQLSFTVILFDLSIYLRLLVHATQEAGLRLT